jgi:DNA-binding Lrp family transcriptional regulator
VIRKDSKSKQNQYWNVLNFLLEDPTRSARAIGKKLNSYRQMVWRKKKELEDNKVIWGYTAVIDERKMNHVLYMMLMKTKPMSRGLADLLIRRITRDEPRKQNVRLINMFYVNGEFDWVLRFSAPDHATARRYYDTIRLLYDEYILEKPVMIDVNFCLVSEGKNNPEIERLYDFIPG